MPKVSEISTYLEQFAPSSLAEEWDNVGLLVGDMGGPADRIMTCLTITSAVVEEAIRDNAQLIIAHHPVLFRAVKKLSSTSPDGRLLLPLLRAGIAIYSPHTAFDNCTGGINDLLAKRLGLTNVVPLRADETRKTYKLVVFVPESDRERVSDAIFKAGAGTIGQYDQCSFRVRGTGTFFANESTNPTIGQKGRREDVDEWRLEVVVPESCLGRVLCAMRAAHSYEEPAFDVYPLHVRDAKPTHGSGRIGEIPPQQLRNLAQSARHLLNANCVQTVGNPQREIRRVAIACGAAGEFITDAIRNRADALLTGEVRFHEALAAESADLCLILPGHYATERPAVEELAARLQRDFLNATVWASVSEQDPLKISS